MGTVPNVGLMAQKAEEYDPTTRLLKLLTKELLEW